MITTKLHMKWFVICFFHMVLMAQAVSPCDMYCFRRFLWSSVNMWCLSTFPCPALYFYFSCLSQISFYPYVLAALIPEKRNVTWFQWFPEIIGASLELLHVVMVFYNLCSHADVIMYACSQHGTLIVCLTRWILPLQT
jgi:hypothetical protein